MYSMGGAGGSIVRPLSNELKTLLSVSLLSLVLVLIQYKTVTTVETKESTAVLKAGT